LKKASEGCCRGEKTPNKNPRSTFLDGSSGWQGQLVEKHAGLAASGEAFLSVAMTLVSLLPRNTLRALI